MASKLDDLTRLEIAQLWINLIQSTALAAIFTWLAISTKPGDVMRRLEEVEVNRAADAVRILDAVQENEQWTKDLTREVKTIATKHPKTKAD